MEKDFVVLPKLGLRSKTSKQFKLSKQGGAQRVNKKKSRCG